MSCRLAGLPTSATIVCGSEWAADMTLRRTCPAEEPGEEGKVVATESPLFVAPTGAYTQREQFFQQQEASGAVTFHYIRNDGVGPHSMW